MGDPLPVVRIIRKMTLRLACQKGDFIFWFRQPNPLLTASFVPKIEDFWVMRNDESFIITNKVEDFPGWFELCPTEKCGFFDVDVNDAEKNLEEPMEGPNLWRAMAGDRLLWYGDARPGQPGVNGILSIFDFLECALVVAEPRGSLDTWLGFQYIYVKKHEHDKRESLNAALAKVRGLGIPRVMATEWLIEC